MRLRQSGEKMWVYCLVIQNLLNLGLGLFSRQPTLNFSQVPTKNIQKTLSHNSFEINDDKSSRKFRYSVSRFETISGVF